MGNDAFEELNESDRTLSIEFPVDEATFADIQRVEDTLLLVDASRMNPGLIAALHPHSLPIRQKMDVTFILEEHVIASHWGTQHLCNGVYLGFACGSIPRLGVCRGRLCRNPWDFNRLCIVAALIVTPYSASAWEHSFPTVQTLKRYPNSARSLFDIPLYGSAEGR